MKSGRRRIVERLARDDLHMRPSAPQGQDLGLEERDLANAIRRNELLLHYQPIVDLRSGMCRRVEALLRWRHPRLGQLAPGTFLHLATSPALLGAMSQWVIATAAAQRLEWYEQGERLGVSVNLSHHELKDITAVASAIRGIDSGAITFEMRPGDADMVGADIRAAALQLSAAGAAVALDDVGADDAPSRALAVAIDEIKIARALVRSVAVDSKARAGIKLLVELARDYKLDTVAVGVEDQRTYEAVASLGCDMAQGYWVSRPLIPDRLRPARRWVTGLALAGAVAFAAQVGAGRAAASGGRTVGLTQSGLFSSGCCLELPSLGDGARRAPSAQVDQLQARTGLPFSASSSSRADVFVETSLGSHFGETVASTVDRDIAELEREFGRQLEGRPSIYFFATRANFALALQQVFGVRAPDAGVLALANGGIALPRQGAIVINLQNVNATELAIVRHELTHAMVNQIIGPEGSLPTWVHEGIATLQERRTGDEVVAARSAGAALSILSAGETRLADLEPASEWIQRNAALDGKGYAVSAEAVRLLEERVSRDGLLRILDAVGRGEAFGIAFAAEAGESLGAFERAFPARLAADHGGARILQASDARGVRWSLAGFTPNTPVSITIQGGSYRVQFEVITDQDGMYQAVFGETAPKGEYVLRADNPTAAANALMRT